MSEDLIEDGSTTSGSGGGISNDGGTLTFTHSLVWNNSSTNPNGGGDSGGIQNYGDPPSAPGKLSIDNSTIADNTAALGGGIFSWCGGTGGACSATGATNTTTITNSTIADNNGGSRGATGGGLLASQGTISVANSIVASNTVDQPQTAAQIAIQLRRVESGRDHLARLQHRDRQPTAASRPPAISRTPIRAS